MRRQALALLIPACLFSVTACARALLPALPAEQPTTADVAPAADHPTPSTSAPGITRVYTYTVTTNAPVRIYYKTADQRRSPDVDTDQLLWTQTITVEGTDKFRPLLSVRANPHGVPSGDHSTDAVTCDIKTDTQTVAHSTATGPTATVNC